MSASTQVKSKQRVADHGEVFTAEREVKAMCDLVKQETERIDSRFLEPACGDGNFLAEVLSRKLAIVKKKYKKVVWLNPKMAPGRAPWREAETAVKEIFPMYKLTVDGLNKAMVKLMTK